jgi:polyisoprenoid-binding protein YceI
MSTWQIDAAHTNVEFAVRHLMISTVRGRFGTLAGTVEYDELDPTHSSVQLTIDTRSIDTREERRDAHLRSADFFEVEKFPAITFTSTGLSGEVTGEFTLTGALTIRDVTRPITVQVTREGQGTDPWGNLRAGYSARARLRRSEFGLSWNQLIEAGGVAVGDEITITIDAELVRQAEVEATAGAA